MHERLKEIIRYKTGGRQTDFAALCGWSPQYVAKLLRGDNFGLAPVKTILALYPDINARWLLFGIGEMLTPQATAALHQHLQSSVYDLLSLDRYMHVMTADELRYFSHCIEQGCMPDFSPALRAELSERAHAREAELNDFFNDAQSKSDELCNQPKASK